MKALLSAQLLKVESKKDRTYNLSFNTQELGGKDAAALLDEVMRQCWLVIASDDREVSEEAIPTEAPPAELGDKHPSVRLRAVLFVLWKQKGEPNTFELFYRHTMEKFIDQVKSLLDAPES